MRRTLSILLLTLCMFSLMSPYMETRANFAGFVAQTAQQDFLIQDLKNQNRFTADTVAVLSIFAAPLLPFLRRSRKTSALMLYLVGFLLLGCLCFLLRFTMTFQIFATIERTFAAFWISQLLTLGSALYLLYLVVTSWILRRKRNPPDTPEFKVLEALAPAV